MERLERMALKIYEKLGPGYNECVYHRAFEVLLRQENVPYETERIVPIVFEGHAIGNLRVDLIVDKQCIVELKAIAKLNESAKTQTKNYMKLTGLKDAILVNFPQGSCSERPEILQFGERE
jgi:GxxExxY protein